MTIPDTINIKYSFHYVKEWHERVWKKVKIGDTTGQDKNAPDGVSGAGVRLDGFDIAAFVAVDQGHAAGGDRRADHSPQDQPVPQGAGRRGTVLRSWVMM